MYIKNWRNSHKIKGFGSYKTLCLTESLVLRNRLFFRYSPLAVIMKFKIIHQTEYAFDAEVTSLYISMLGIHTSTS